MLALSLVNLSLISIAAHTSGPNSGFGRHVSSQLAHSESGLQIKHLTDLQVDNLALLARIWGFLKYHHPSVTSGSHNWDDELFQVMPAILNAHDRQAATGLLVKWIDDLGPVSPCDPCSSLIQTGLKLKPDVGWIEDSHSLGRPLSQRLRFVYRNRVPRQQFYVASAPNVGNPIFSNESDYGSVNFPDSGFQLLGLFRLWNIVEYWYPDRDVIDDDWLDVLKQYIKRIGLAADQDAYTLAMMSFVAHIRDTHANLISRSNLRPPQGECRLPINVQFVNGKPIVAGYSQNDAGRESGLQPGDEITRLDDIPIERLIDEWAPFYGASNLPARLRTIARSLTNGTCGSVQINVQRNGSSKIIRSNRRTSSENGFPTLTHDRPGAAFQLLSNQIAYLKLSDIRVEDIPGYIRSAKGTKGFVIDIRNYPKEFAVFALGSHFVRKDSPFAIFTRADLSNPGAFYLTRPVTLKPADPYYKGKLVILVDEVTMSQAEYTVMALRSSPEAIVVGSTTAGADGNVSKVPLPGMMSTMISGIEVLYPDSSPTQRVGVRIDTVVHPTVLGIQTGRDEILEEAIRQIAPEMSEQEIEKIARH